MQYQRNPEGTTNPPSGYPPVPDATEFQNRNYGYEVPTQVHYWTWRTDYQRWGACVTFADGWHGITGPKPEKV